MLNLFNVRDSYTLKELEELTEVPKEKLTSGLLMFCNPKMKLLLK